jgi:hypothetical protein
VASIRNYISRARVVGGEIPRALSGLPLNLQTKKEVVIMAYIRKTVDRWDIMSNYGYGWECECSEYTFKEAKQRLKEYRENGGGCYYLKKRREKAV